MNDEKKRGRPKKTPEQKTQDLRQTQALALDLLDLQALQAPGDTKEKLRAALEEMLHFGGIDGDTVKQYAMGKRAMGTARYDQLSRRFAELVKQKYAEESEKGLIAQHHDVLQIANREQIARSLLASPSIGFSADELRETTDAIEAARPTQEELARLLTVPKDSINKIAEISRLAERIADHATSSKRAARRQGEQAFFCRLAVEQLRKASAGDYHEVGNAALLIARLIQEGAGDRLAAYLDEEFGTPTGHSAGDSSDQEG